MGFSCLFSINLLYWQGKEPGVLPESREAGNVKSKTWLALLGAVLLVCLVLSLWLLRPGKAAGRARIESFGKTVKTVDLRVDQEFTVTGENGGVNVVTVRDGKIAVTQASCPDHYCVNRGFCGGGTDIVCLPNRLVVHFLQAQTVDAQAG